MKDTAAIKAINDQGGSAFPFTVVDVYTSGVPSKTQVFTGMTLRDWFAGQAMVALGNTNPHLPDSPASASNWPTTEELMRRQASFAYAMADAMLTERVR